MFNYKKQILKMLKKNLNNHFYIEPKSRKLINKVALSC